MWAVLTDLVTESGAATLYVEGADPKLAAKVENINNLVSELSLALAGKFSGRSQ